MPYEAEARGAFTAEENLRGAQAHFDKYEALAQRLGVAALSRIVPFTESRIRAALSDPSRDAVDRWSLNALPLKRWDDCHDAVVSLFRWRTTWSLCETVCVLKHVAVHHIAGERRPQ